MQLGLVEYNGFFYNMKDERHYQLNNEEKYVDRLFLSKLGDNSFFAIKEDFDDKVTQPNLDISPEVFIIFISIELLSNFGLDFINKLFT